MSMIGGEEFLGDICTEYEKSFNSVISKTNAPGLLDLSIAWAVCISISDHVTILAGILGVKISDSRSF